MKIIDQKGKLFGLINIIDLCVLLVLVLAVGVIGYKVIGNKVVNLPGQGGAKQELLVTAKVFGIRTGTIHNAMKKGDQLISLTSTVNAYIESVSTEQADDKVATADGHNVLTKDPLRVDVTIKFKMWANSNDTFYKLGSQDVAVAKGFEVKTRTADVVGVVTDITVVK